MCTALRKNATCASNCVGCGKCEKHCPQGIKIREKLNDAKKELENMTGMTVVTVNVHIQGINYDKKDSENGGKNCE